MQTILMELQQVMNPGFDISISAPRGLHGRQQTSF
jgi:hypothetical protein